MIHYVPFIFVLSWLTHYEYDMAEVDDNNELVELISKDYAKYYVSFSAGMDLPTQECVNHFLKNELEQ